MAMLNMHTHELKSVQLKIMASGVMRSISGLGMLTAALVGVLATVACTGKSSPSTTVGGEAKANNNVSEKLKVGLVLDRGGKDDKSFNSAAFRGATQAVQDLGIELKEVECADDSAFEPAMRTFAERGYPLVLAIGFAQVDSLNKVAPQFPNTHFAIIDGVVNGPNVASLMFQEHEGSYVVGYLAGLASKTAKIGFVGGMEVPLIRRFEMGFEAGIKAANPKAVLFSNYAGVNSSAWANPARGKELALGQYAKGADIVFAVAGATNMGVFDAAEEKKQFAIGVDSNQNGLRPGRILTSMLKRVDTAVYQAIKDQREGKFQAGTRYFGLADKGVDYSVDENNQSLIAPFQPKLEEIKTKIIKGEIQVPDYYKIKK